MSLATRGFVCIAAAVLAAGCSGPASDEATASAPAGREPQSQAAGARTYSAQELLAWPRAGDANWREAAGGAVQADGGSGFLVTPEAYEDFAISVEFWVTPDANSGVFVRCQDPASPGADTCYEINIFDQRPDQTYRTGGIVDVAAPSEVIYTGGRWNRFEISARGSALEVVLNDRPVVSARDERFRSGPIALQYGGGTVLFRNVRIGRR